MSANESILRDQLDAHPQPLFRIFRGKLSFPSAPTEESLLEWLANRGLAKVSQSRVYTDMHDAVIELPRDLGYQYIGLAAAKAALDGNRDLAADRSEFVEPILYDARAARAEVATRTLDAFVPEGLSELEPDRLSDIRADLSASRLKYQAAIAAVVDEYAQVASEGELSALQRTITEIATDRVNETDACYKRAKVRTAIEGLGVSLTPPAVATTIASALGIGIFPPVGIAMAISLFSAGTLFKLREAKVTRRDSPWSYVLDVANRSSPRPHGDTAKTMRRSNLAKYA